MQPQPGSKHLPLLNEKYSGFTKEELLFYHMFPLKFMKANILATKAAEDKIPYDFTPQQQEFIENFSDSKKMICKAGRGTGKTMLIACFCIWFVTIYKDAKVFITGPSEGQLKSALFSEIKLWLNNSAVSHLFEITDKKIYIKDAYRTGCGFIEIKCAPKGQPTAVSGLHANNMLIISDEVFGVHTETLQFMEDSLTSGPNNRMICVGNPTNTMGFAAEIFKRNIVGWYKMTMNAEDSPIADKEQILEKLVTWGREHFIYRSSVLGEFPLANADAFIGLHLVEEAFHRDVQGFGVVEVACDVARFGADKTVCMWRHGMEVMTPKSLDKTDSFQIAELVLKTVEEARKATGYTKKIKVKIDTSGGWGAGAYDILVRDRKHNIEVIGVNFAKSAYNKKKYADLPTEMWATLRGLMSQISLPNPDEHPSLRPVLDRMKNELSARRIQLTDKSQEKVESKTRYKTEYGHSPDYADTLVMLFANIKSERSVAKGFDPVDDKVVIHKLEYTNDFEEYVSLFYSKDRLASMVIAKYDGKKLIITGEAITDDNLAMVASHIKHRTNPRRLRKLVGNDRCFNSSSKDDVKGQFKRNYNITLKRNKKYDELGAITLFNELIDTKRFAVLGNCVNVVKQVSDWQMGMSQQELETEFGTCYAIINLISELKDQLKPKNIIRNRAPEPSYSEVKNDNQKINLRRVHARAYCG